MTIINNPDGPPRSRVDVPKVFVQWSDGLLSGAPVRESVKPLRELKGIFHDAEAQERMNPEQEVYRVRWWSPEPAGTQGGLFWGVTILQNGKVGDEFFMTHGHSHSDPSRAEYYVVVSGSGMLLRMDESRSTWGEEMSPGSLHYIDGRYAHRVVNTGGEPLVFWACWGTDAGYDYDSIREHGFGARVLDWNGTAALTPQG